MELKIVEKSSYGGGEVVCEREQSVKGRRRGETYERRRALTGSRRAAGTDIG